MLEQAEETAERLGWGLVTSEVAECRAALGAITSGEGNRTQAVRVAMLVATCLTEGGAVTT